MTTSSTSIMSDVPCGARVAGDPAAPVADAQPLADRHVVRPEQFLADLV